jgi:hypothetical protein
MLPIKSGVFTLAPKGPEWPWCHLRGYGWWNDGMMEPISTVR